MKRSETELHATERLPRQLDWNLLRTFMAVVEARSISRAAESLLLTQSAVSQAVKRLEQSLNATLIERTARKFEVTSAGKVVYEKAQEIYRSVAGLAPLATNEAPGLVGNVRLLLASSIKSVFMDEVLHDFHQRNPAVLLRIDVLPSSEIRAQVRQGAASAGLCLLRGKTGVLKSELFLRQRFGLYCGRSHELFGQSQLTADALLNQDFVTYPSDQIGGVLSPLAVYREQHVFEGRVRATSSNLEEICRMTILGIGVGLLPMHVAEEYEQRGELWRLPPYDGIGPIDIHLIWRPSSEASRADIALVDAFRARLSVRNGPEVAKYN